MKTLNENTKVTLTLGQLRRLVKESFDDEAPEVAYTVRNNTRTFSHSDQPKEYGTCRTEEDAEKMRHWLARKDPSWRLENTEVVPKDLDPMLPIHWTNVDGLEDDEEDEPLDETVKESGMTIEDAFDQMEQDVRKAKYAYLEGEVEEASNTVFEIIKDAKGISNRLTETTGGPLVENGQGLVDQVLEDPQVRNRAEQFINALIEYAVEYDEYNYPAGDNVTRSDEMRWEDLVKAIRVVVARYKGAK